MSSYRYYVIESDNTQGFQDAKSGQTYFLPSDIRQNFVLRPHYWKKEGRTVEIKPQDELEAKTHTFKTKVFKHPSTCQVCSEVIWNEGRTCRVCKFACHRKCEYKVTVACITSTNYALLSDVSGSSHTQLKTSISGDCNQNTMTAHVHAELSKMSSEGDSYIKYAFDLDVDYITERLIAGGLEAQYRSNLRDVVQMLKSKHQDKYVVFNLSQKRHDIKQLNAQVYEQGWPNHLAPSLEKLCSVCKHIETWLKADPHNVLVLHCKGGRGPIGVVVLAYMNYMSITAKSETAVDRYAMKRFLDAKTESAMQPSQHRYVNYFTGLLMKSIQVNSAPLFLHHVLIHGVPNYDINGGCRPFLRVYQGIQPIYTSGVYSVPEGTGRFAITLDQALPIRGDILVKCYHKKFRATTRDVIFRCQFHTTAVMECRLVYQKADLDDACTDPRFPDFTKVEFVFSHTPDKLHGSDYVAGSSFPVDETDDPMIRWDSYENFETTIEGGDYSPEVIDLSVSTNNNIPHSSAPDGSLYAEVQKTPSPVQQDKPFFHSPSQSAPVSPGSNQLTPIVPNALDFTGPLSPMQTTQMAVMRAKMTAQMDPRQQMSRQRSPSPRTPTSDPPSPMQPKAPSVQFANDVSRPNELANGPKSSETSSSTQKRTLNSKEKRDLDDLLRGIGEDATTPSSPDSMPSGEEVAEERKFVDVQAQMSHLPFEPGYATLPKVYRPQHLNTQGEVENPYAEIADTVPVNRDRSARREKDMPCVEETISSSHVEREESYLKPDINGFRTAQLHDNPTYGVTKGKDEYLASGTPVRHPGTETVSPVSPNTWQAQPLRAKKEQILFIYKEDPTSPRGPTLSSSAADDDDGTKPPESTPISSTRTSAEIDDDAMTWLQRQQQKLKERRRKGDVHHPSFQTPSREPPKVLNLPSEADQSSNNVIHTQIFTPTEEVPTNNLSWLERKQRQLQMKRQQTDQTSKPLFVDTSHSGISAGPSLYHPKTDSSGLISSNVVNSPGSSSSERSVRSKPHHPVMGPMTPPHTYEHESNTEQLPAWQAHQRPLNRQTSDITHDREKPAIGRKQDTAQNGLASLPPAGPPAVLHKDGSSRHYTHRSTPISESRDCQTLNKTLEGQQPPVTCLADSINPSVAQPSPDSGYSSSISSAVSGNEPSMTPRVEETRGNETTTTSTQTKRRVIRVYPRRHEFDMKRLPVLFMQEISNKDESSGLQSHLVELMKEKGVGISPVPQRKAVSRLGQAPIDGSGSSTAEQGKISPQEERFVQGKSSLEPVCCPVPTSASCVPSFHNSPQNKHPPKSTLSENIATSSSTSPSLSLPRKSQNDSFTLSRFPRSHSLSPSLDRKPLRKQFRLNDPFSSAPFEPDVPKYSGNFLKAERKGSKSSQKHVRSQSLPRNPTSMRSTNYNALHLQSLPRQRNLGSQCGKTHVCNSKQSKLVQAKILQQELKESSQPTPQFTKAGLINSPANRVPRNTQYAPVSSEFDHVHQIRETVSSGIPQADPKPFIDDTLLVQPLPTYSWVMERIQSLRNAYPENLNEQPDPQNMCKLVKTEQVRDHGRREGKQMTEHIRTRSRPFGRHRHKSGEGSTSQNQDVWLRREDYDASMREPQSASADRVQDNRSCDFQSHSTWRRQNQSQQISDHSAGSYNVQEQSVQTQNTNSTRVLFHANQSSGVTSRGKPCVRTNPNGNTNLMMAGLEDAIRMLSEMTHLQSQGPAFDRPSTTKHNTHVIDGHRHGDLTDPRRQTNPSNERIEASAKYQSHTQLRQQVPFWDASGPAVSNSHDDNHRFNLHIDESSIEEPPSLDGRVANRVADFSVKTNESDQPKFRSPTGPQAASKAKQVTRRTPQQSGYDSDSAIQQYYDPPSRRTREESPERWLCNPGGLPNQESEYWNRVEGLKSPNLKEQWLRKPEYEIGSSNESLQNGSMTPKFPVGPKAYKNMVSTPIAVVGRPPHGPDAPYPLSPIKRDDRDIFDTTNLYMSPSRQISTDYASRLHNGAPNVSAAQSNTPSTPEVITVTHRRIVHTDRVDDQNGLWETPPSSGLREPAPQPITAKVERVPTSARQVEIRVEKQAVRNGQHYPVEAKVERVPVTNYSIHEQQTYAKPPNPPGPAAGLPPSPKKEVTFQESRGGVPGRPTGPQALAGTQNTPHPVQESEIVPTLKKPVEVSLAWPIEVEVQVKNEETNPLIGDVRVLRGEATPQNSPQQLSPVSQNWTPVQESYIQQERIEKEQVEPDFSHQLRNLAHQPPAPQYPTYSDRLKNKPPGPLYPTFSDRHRKAAAGCLEEVPPQVANAYHTMYDNRAASRTKRASTGSDGVWSGRPGHQRKPSDGGIGPTASGRTTPSNFYLMQHPSPYSSSLSLADTSLEKVRFVKDLSAWWYKPHISRDEAISMLKDKCPGQFVVRDSNSFPGAFGLAVKVAQLPPNAPPSKKATDPASELVRHFLIEPNPRGVRLKGCANEPIFGSLSALIYQHTLTQLALPCKLLLPESDPSSNDATDSAIDPKSAHALLSQGAACNVLYLATMEMESLTGPNAVHEATSRLFNMKDKPRKVVVHFKVSLKGITLTDNQRKLFFRRHYPVEAVLFCGADSAARRWKRKDGSNEIQAKIFGFVCRKPGSKTDNQCHLFAEYEMEQPASAIVSFVTKVLLGSAVHK